MGHRGLALATSLSAIFTAITLLYHLRKKIGNLGLKAMTQSSVKTLISSVIMGIVVYFIYNYSVAAFNPSRLVELVIVLLSVVMGIAVYVVALYLFKVEELHFVIDYAKRQLEERKIISNNFKTPEIRILQSLERVTLESRSDSFYFFISF